VPAAAVAAAVGTVAAAVGTVAAVGSWGCTVQGPAVARPAAAAQAAVVGCTAGLPGSRQGLGTLV
jgi:hypothetical protein